MGGAGRVHETIAEGDNEEQPGDVDSDASVLGSPTEYSQREILKAAIEQDNAAEAAAAAQAAAHAHGLVGGPATSRPSTAASRQKSRAATPMVVSHESILDYPVFPSAAAEARPPSVLKSRGGETADDNNDEGRSAAGDDGEGEGDGNRASGGDSSRGRVGRFGTPRSRATTARSKVGTAGSSTEPWTTTPGTAERQLRAKSRFRPPPKDMRDAEVAPSDDAEDVDAAQGAKFIQRRRRQQQQQQQQQQDADADDTAHGRKRGGLRKWSFHVQRDITGDLERQLAAGTPVKGDDDFDVDGHAGDGGSEDASAAASPSNNDDVSTLNRQQRRRNAKDGGHDDGDDWDEEEDGTGTVPRSDEDYLAAAGYSKWSEDNRRWDNEARMDQRRGAGSAADHHQRVPSEHEEDLMPGFVPSGAADIYRHSYHDSDGGVGVGDDGYEKYDQYRYELPEIAPVRKAGQRPAYQMINLRPDPLLSGSSFTDVEAVQRRMYGIVQDSGSSDEDDDDDDDDNDVNGSGAVGGRREDATERQPEPAAQPQMIYFHRGQLQVCECVC